MAAEHDHDPIMRALAVAVVLVALVVIFAATVRWFGDRPAAKAGCVDRNGSAIAC